MDERSIDVGDERALGYREFGDPNGQPVVNCHGGLVCGLDVAPFHEGARELGVRIISPDRPGIALSDPAPGRTTADWADDVRALIDALGVARTAVLGWSMGGQYALACAARLNDRVTRTVVIAGAVPLDDETAFAELNSMDRRFTRLAQHHPHLASTLFATLGEIARHTPDVWAHLTARGAVPGEAEAMRALPDPGIAAAAAAALGSSGRHGRGIPGLGAALGLRPRRCARTGDDLARRCRRARSPAVGTRVDGPNRRRPSRATRGRRTLPRLPPPADVLRDLMD